MAKGIAAQSHSAQKYVEDSLSRAAVATREPRNDILPGNLIWGLKNATSSDSVLSLGPRLLSAALTLDIRTVALSS